MAEQRLIFDVVGRDRISPVFDRIGDDATRMGRRISRAGDDSNRSIERFTRDANNRLHDTRGRFISAAEAARRMGDDIDGGSRQGQGALSRLMGVLSGVGSAAVSALPSLGAVGPTLMGIGIAAAVTALPALGALVPMLAGLGLAGVAVKMAFSGVGGAMALAGTDAKAYRKALKQMSPEQRDFTKALVAAKKEFSGIGKEVQKAMLPGFTKAVKAAAPLISDLSAGLVAMGQVLGDTADSFSKLMKDSGFQDDFGNTLLLGTGFVRDLTDGLVPLTKSIFDFGAKSKPTLDAFGKGISGLLGKGIPGFFKGLEKGIDGAAKMFDGLFQGLGKVLPALGSLSGTIANSVGPFLGSLFKYVGELAQAVVVLLTPAIAALKPLFDSMSGALDSTSGSTLKLATKLGPVLGKAVEIVVISLKNMFDIFKFAVPVVKDLASAIGGPLISTFMEMTGASDKMGTFNGKLKDFSNWAANHKEEITAGFRQMSVAIMDMVISAVDNLPQIYGAFKTMVSGSLTALGLMLTGADKAFGWIPTIGPKIHAAAQSFGDFRSTVGTRLDAAGRDIQAFSDAAKPKLERNKLQLQIDSWNAQIAVAKKNLKDVPPSKRAKLLADIADLLRKKKQAQDAINNLQGKTVVLTIRQAVAAGKMSSQAAANAINTRAAGGPISGPGTGTSDSIPAMLSDGEYVVNARATGRNRPLLEAINSGRIAQFASGGSVGRSLSKSSLSTLTSDTAHRMVVELTGSTSQINTWASKLISDIQKAFKGKKSRVDDHLVAMLEKGNKRLKTLAAERDKIAATIAEAKQFATDTAANAKGTATLANLGTDALTGGGGGIKAGLQSKLAQIRQFSRYISVLAKDGLNKTMLREILEMGPEAGFAYASELAGSSKKTISEINGVQSQIGKASTSLGRQGADVLYDSGKNAGKGFLAGLQGQQKNIEKLMLNIATGMQKAIRKALGIKSPSTVMARLGAYSTDGISVGATSRIPALQRAMAKVSDAVAGTDVSLGQPVMGRPAGGGGGGAANVTINVNGAYDPLAVATQIRRMLLELKRTHGVNINLGVG